MGRSCLWDGDKRVNKVREGKGKDSTLISRMGSLELFDSYFVPRLYSRAFGRDKYAFNFHPQLRFLFSLLIRLCQIYVSGRWRGIKMDISSHIV